MCVAMIHGYIWNEYCLEFYLEYSNFGKIGTLNKINFCFSVLPNLPTDFQGTFFHTNTLGSFFAIGTCRG